MKNKLCYILLGILLNFSFINVVFAADYQVNISATPSKTEVLEGEEVLVIVKMQSDSLVDTCLFETNFDSNLEYVDINLDTNLSSKGWYLNFGSSNSFGIENMGNSTASLSDGVNILQMKYKVNGNTRLSIKTVNCSYAANNNKDEQVEDTEIETINIDFKVKTLSEVTTLESLNVTKGGTLNEKFDPNKNVDYFINLTSLNFGLEWKTTNPEYQNNVKVINYGTDEEISDPNNIMFESNGDGAMPLQVVVSGNDGNSTTYTLIALLSEQVEYNNTLKSITINGKKIELIDGKFENGKFEYEYTVDSDVSSITIDAELNDSESFKFGDNGNAPGTFSINDIVNVEIVVEPKSSAIEAISRSYKIQITRKQNETTKPEEDDEEDDEKKPTTGGNGSSGNINYNPDSGETSMYLMGIILIVSLIGSIFLYQKNLDAYK